MLCPVCTNTQLVMSERQGIEIDYCPQCRGVWLDRGELDKIIERSAAGAPEGFGRQAASRSDEHYQAPSGYHGDDKHEHHKHAQHHHPHYKDDYHRRKKKGFLGELFDFD